MTWLNRIALLVGGVLLLVAAQLPWARYGLDGFESINLFEFHDGVANGAYIAVALSLGLVYRARSGTGRRIGRWVSLAILAALIGVSIFDISRGDLLVSSTGWVIRNDVSAGAGPAVVIAGALLLVAAVLSRRPEHG